MHTKKIGLIKHGGLGDHIVGTPVIRYIRKFEPEAHLTLFCGLHHAAFYKKNPFLNRVIPVPSIYDLNSRGSVDLAMFDKFLRGVTGEEFDYIYNPSHDIDLYLTGIIAGKIKAKRKISFRQTVNQYTGYDSNRHYSELLDRPPLSHVAYYQNIFFEREYGQKIEPLNYDIFLSDEDGERIRQAYADAMSSNRLVAIHAHGSMGYRQLAPAQVVALSDGIKAMGLTPLVVGSTNYNLGPDRLTCTGDLEILEICYLIAHCRATVCVDSAIKHMASVADVSICEVSHLPDDLAHLNGPFIDGFKYCAIDFWAPHLVKGRHTVVKPANDTFKAEDIESGKTIRSIPPEQILSGLQKIL